MSAEIQPTYKRCPNLRRLQMCIRFAVADSNMPPHLKYCASYIPHILNSEHILIAAHLMYRVHLTMRTFSTYCVTIHPYGREGF